MHKGLTSPLRGLLTPFVSGRVLLRSLFLGDRNGAFHDWSGHGAAIGLPWLFDGDRDGATHDFTEHGADISLDWLFDAARDGSAHDFTAHDGGA